MAAAGIRIPLRVVFYYEGDAWGAQCLEFDLAGTGSSKDEALAMLADAIECQVQFSLESGESVYSSRWEVFPDVGTGSPSRAGRTSRSANLCGWNRRTGIEGIDAREFCNNWAEYTTCRIIH